ELRELLLEGGELADERVVLGVRDLGLVEHVVPVRVVVDPLPELLDAELRLGAAPLFLGGHPYPAISTPPATPMSLPWITTPPITPAMRWRWASPRFMEPGFERMICIASSAASATMQLSATTAIPSMWRSDARRLPTSV